MDIFHKLVFMSCWTKLKIKIFSLMAKIKIFSLMTTVWGVLMFSVWLDTRSSMWPGCLTSPMTFTLDLSRSNFWIAVSMEFVGLINVKRKGNKFGWILGKLYDLALWPYAWPWPWVFKVRVWNSLILGMGRPFDMEWKGNELIIHDHDCDLWVTMLGVGGCMDCVTSDVGVQSTHLVIRDTLLIAAAS